MHLDLLVRPMPLGTKGQVVRILEVAKGRFHMMLSAITPHDVSVAPIVVVGEQNRLAEQGALQALPGRPLETITQRGQALRRGSDGDAKEFFHVACGQPRSEERRVGKEWRS